MADTLIEAIVEYTDAILDDSIESPASRGLDSWMDQPRLNEKLSQFAQFIIIDAKKDVVESVNTFTQQNTFGQPINQIISYNMNGVKVIGNQRPAIADATTGGEVDRINEILAALRGHGLIAS